MQSVKLSVIESIVSTIFGYIIAVALYLIVLPLFGYDVNLNQSIVLTAIFALVSTIRGFVIRRLFNLIDRRF